MPTRIPDPLSYFAQGLIYRRFNGLVRHASTGIMDVSDSATMRTYSGGVDWGVRFLSSRVRKVTLRVRIG